MIRVCVAGATGWTGGAVARALLGADGLELVSAVARTHAGRDLGAAWGGEPVGVPVTGTVLEALAAAPADVLVDYTSHEAVRAHVGAAIERGVAVVVGSSGLTAADYAAIDEAATARGVGVVAAGNFSVTAALAQAAALLVAPHLPHAEVIDYASAGKRDAPSGTARELAERLSGTERAVTPPMTPADGPPEARGAEVGRVRVHSLRLPSFSVSTEVVFGLSDERLTIRHDAGGSAAPYVAGTLLAIRAVTTRPGLTRGLDTLLLGGGGGTG
ncbi:4-hydroxy-tetrahydrodipicolinate reductase [Streptomyces sp. NBC_01803]|uniref:4-hydroxy-tetrahydrodipicolinate reductase n=1 Tax=Streptomyces sp. NBC_01803 TaxID=2975946 RepID=UPI002DDC09D5|nr:4-hydroxy-tetrahydrodipicolinate reductase [Streptomyces sp. NBC_01803]WSA43132.1 4-hydroxy-tetrahydrodipicolinate reductase [Streptomyces sp. NBC_01803]